MVSEKQVCWVKCQGTVSFDEDSQIVIWGKKFFLISSFQMVRILFKMSLIIYFNALGQRTLLLSVDLSLCQSCGQGAGGVVVPGKNKAIGSPRGSLRAPQVGGAKFLEASRSILGCWGPVPEAGPTLLPTSNALLPVA